MITVPLVLVSSFLLFSKLQGHVMQDMDDHARFLPLFLEHGSFPVPPGYPFLLWMFAGFSSHTPKLLEATPWVLSLMISLKLAVMLFAIIATWQQFFQSRLKASSLLIIMLLSLSLMVATPLYSFGESYYFGRIALTIWHNPTTMAVTPFALMLFLLTPAFLENPRGNAWKILSLGFLNLLFKPSFLFAYIPGVFLYAIITGKRKKDLLLVFLPLFALGVMILGQYLLIYASGSLDEIIYNSRSHGILLRPFMVWNQFLEWGGIGFWASLLVSLAFPLLFLAFYGASGKVWPLTWLGACLLLIGLMIAWMLAEGGARLWHGNFLWTPYLANLALFLACFLNLLSFRKTGKSLSFKEWLLYGLFALQVVSGILYLNNILVTETFG